MAENTLVAEPRPWYTTKQLCGAAGGNLSIAKSGNLAEFSVSIRDSVGAWLGGRRVAQSWEWAGNSFVVIKLVSLCQHYCFLSSLLNENIQNPLTHGSQTVSTLRLHRSQRRVHIRSLGFKIIFTLALHRALSNKLLKYLDKASMFIAVKLICKNSL